MKAKVFQTPKGYRRLRKTQDLKAGDRFPVMIGSGLYKWDEITACIGHKADPAIELIYGFFIRKLSQKGRAAK